MLYPLPQGNTWPVKFPYKNISTITPGPNAQVKLKFWPVLMTLGSGERHSGSFRHHELPSPKLSDLNYPKFVALET